MSGALRWGPASLAGTRNPQCVEPRNESAARNTEELGGAALVACTPGECIQDDAALCIGPVGRWFGDGIRSRRRFHGGGEPCARPVARKHFAHLLDGKVLRRDV